LEIANFLIAKLPILNEEMCLTKYLLTTSKNSSTLRRKGFFLKRTNVKVNKGNKTTSLLTIYTKIM